MDSGRRMGMAGSQVRCHAHGYAVSDLVADDGLRAIGHVRGNLDAAVHGLRVHDDGVGAGGREAFRREPVLGEIAIRVGKVGGLPHALLLNAQHHHDVDVLEPGLQGSMARATGEFLRSRHQSRGRDYAQVGAAEGAKDVVIGASDARVPDVTDDDDAQGVEMLLVLPHRQRVQQSLCGMRYVCLTRGEHADVRRDVGRHGGRHAGFGVANDHRVDVQRLKRVDRIQHALALDAGGELDFEVDDVGAEAFRGKLEGDAGAGGGLGEEVGDRAAGEDMADRRPCSERPDEALGPFEQPLHALARQAFQGNEVPEGSVGA